jgi:hypothetical protein
MVIIHRKILAKVVMGKVEKLCEAFIIGILHLSRMNPDFIHIGYSLFV